MAVVHLKREQIDALATGYLGIQVVLFRDLTQNDEFVRSDFTTRNSRHHGIGTVLLDIGQHVIVRILQTPPMVA